MPSDGFVIDPPEAEPLEAERITAGDQGAPESDTESPGFILDPPDPELDAPVSKDPEPSRSEPRPRSARRARPLPHTPQSPEPFNPNALEPNALEPSRTPGGVGDLLTLLGVTGLFVSQPLLAVFGAAPEQFVHRGAGRSEIVGFALGVALLPALLAWSTIWLASRFSVRGAQVTRALAITTAAGVGVVHLVRPQLSGGPIWWLVGLAIGAALAYGVHASRDLAVWTRVLAVVPVAAVGFFIASPTGDLIRGGDAGAAQALASDFDQDVVMILFDELPTSTLVGNDGAIDPIRFPNFAAFAETSTWYRRFTAVNGQTKVAIPSMLTGQFPEELVSPLWTEHPNSIFTTLAPTHDLVVQEPTTRICAPELCTNEPVPPESAADVPDAPRSSVASSGDTRPLRLLSNDAFTVFVDRVSGRTEQDLSGLSEEVVELDATRTTVPRGPAASPGSDSPVDDALPSVADPSDADPSDADPSNVDPTQPSAPATTVEPPAFRIREGLTPDLSNQPLSVSSFLDAALPSPDPSFYYAHFVLPHQRWQFTENGVRYGYPEDAQNLIQNPWFNPHVAAVNHQLHVLQTQYTDALLGQLLATLDQRGISDDAWVIVAADHGFNFGIGAYGRSLDTDDPASMMAVPLFVKAPGQDGASIVDESVQSHDLLPLLAEQMGLELAFETDGLAPGDPARDERGDDASYIMFPSPLLDSADDETRVLNFDAETLGDAALTPRSDPARATDAFATASVSRRADSGADALLGTSILEHDAPVAPGLGVEWYGDEVSSRPLPGVLTGRLLGSEAGRRGVGSPRVAVAIDGVIIGLSPVFDWRAGAGDEAAPIRTDTFMVVVPEEYLDDTDHEVSIGLAVGGSLVARAS